MNLPTNVEIVENCLAAEAQSAPLKETKLTCFGKYVVKHGRVTGAEAANQQHAFTLLDHDTLRVPEVYRYFSTAGRDYLVMEYIEGHREAHIEDQETINVVAKALNHLHGFTSSNIGPLGGGSFEGTLWPQDENVNASSREDLEHVINSRLTSTDSKFCLTDTPMVFVHGDLAPRNILFVGDGVCLLDWEFAGYFPRAAEFAALNQDYGVGLKDRQFRDRLAAALEPLKEFESRQAELLLHYAFNNLRYSW
ncbi:hypothetical protein LTR62_002359 [Meristemomyces frigidus]|uniref:non-specific serine/threonine protein kinase n=1 Tax=Meristemomyces frigidus TaxID=1508187 RepID=A0AAN7YAU7_9PEZI|nr:hypothetical protein LTR62_002359 [Meristemomyces frigidus]